MSLLKDFFKIKENLADVGIAWTNKSGDDPYDSTPIGAFVFAYMGVDGVSYCIVPREGDLNLENSPVYTLSPMDFSEGTVVWTAKNIQDFLRLTLLCKNASFASGIYCGIDEETEAFLAQMDFEISQYDEPTRERISKALKAIEGILPQAGSPDSYRYFIECYRDKNNHLDLKFKDTVNMRGYKPGCYCHA